MTGKLPEGTQSLSYGDKKMEDGKKPDRQFIEKLAVSLHGFGGEAGTPVLRTTGRWLHERGIFPSPDVKGSRHDRAMQHACYPFVLFNIFAFWYCLAYRDMANYERRIIRLMEDKVETVRGWLDDYRRNGARSEFSRWMEP